MHSSFLGYAPANNPKIVVYVGIDEPANAAGGGAAAGPVFKEIVSEALSYMGVPKVTSGDGGSVSISVKNAPSAQRSAPDLTEKNNAGGQKIAD